MKIWAFWEKKCIKDIKLGCYCSYQTPHEYQNDWICLYLICTECYLVYGLIATSEPNRFEH